MLVSIVTFAPVFASEPAKIVIQTDNMAAITTAMKLSSPKPLMNALAGELSLRLEQLQCSIKIAEHIPGLLDFVADALSRLEAGKRLPESLATARRFSAPSRADSFFRAWPGNWK